MFCEVKSSTQISTQLFWRKLFCYSTLLATWQRKCIFQTYQSQMKKKYAHTVIYIMHGELQAYKSFDVLFCLCIKV